MLTKKFRNIVWDTVAGDNVSWPSDDQPDSSGATYPGPGTFGVDTSNFRYQDVGSIWVAGSGTDVDAIHDNVAAEINAIASKGAPVGADVIVIEDSDATFDKKSTTLGAISHTILADKGSNAHSVIDTHLGSSSNPHTVTKSQVSLSNVTDDAQLKRAADDWSAITEEASPAAGDWLLLEQTSGGAKRKAQVSNVGGSGTDDDAIHDNVSGEINAIASKTPVSTDVIVMEDSDATFAKKKTPFSNVSHTLLADKGSNAHSVIDTHLGSSSNPHTVTKSQVSLTNVTDDAQLKRADNDWAGYSDTPSPGASDMILIEGSGGGSKSTVQITNLPGTGTVTEEDIVLAAWTYN